MISAACFSMVNWSWPGSMYAKRASQGFVLRKRTGYGSVAEKGAGAARSVSDQASPVAAADSRNRRRVKRGAMLWRRIASARCALNRRRRKHALPADLRPTPRHLNTFKKGLT